MVQLTSTVNGRMKTMTLQNVAYTPTFRANLISVPCMQSAGLEARFPRNIDAFVGIKGKDFVMNGSSRTQNVAELHGVEVRTGHQTAFFVNGGHTEVNLNLLHRCLTHVNCQTIKDMINHDVVKGLDAAKNQYVKYAICNECKAGKVTAVPHRTSSTTTTNPGELIHADIVGPITPTSLGGASYILTVLDDANAGSWVAFMKQKSETPKRFKKILNCIRLCSRTRTYIFVF